MRPTRDLLQELLTKLFFLRLLLGLLPGERGGIIFVGWSVHLRHRRAVLSPQMSSTTMCKCLHCKESYRSDPRKRGRQRYCSKPDCRRASKAASQRQWTSRPENQDYFRGAVNTERVRQWRLTNTAYRRNKKSAPESALQEMAISQPVGNLTVAPSELQIVLQDLVLSQHPLLVGLISVLTGHVLQDDLVPGIRSFIRRSLDILGRQAALGSAQITEPGLAPNSHEPPPEGALDALAVWLTSKPGPEQYASGELMKTPVRASGF